MDEENRLEQAGNATNNDQPSVKVESTILSDVESNCSYFLAAQQSSSDINPVKKSSDILESPLTGASLEKNNLEDLDRKCEDDQKTKSKDKEIASCEKAFDMFDGSFDEEKSNGDSPTEKISNQVDISIDSLENNSFKSNANTEKLCELLCEENPDDASVTLLQNEDESQTFHREAKKRKSEDDVSSESNDDDDEFMDAQGEPPEARSKINKKFKRLVHGSSSSSDSDNDDISNSSQSSCSKESSSEKKEEKLLEDQQWLNKDISSLPEPRWKALNALRQRETLRSSVFWPVKVCGSQAMVKRFKLEAELDRHNGCVNALHFNQSGTLIASGSDDLRVMLWDWVNNSKEPAVNYESGHKSNVFQAKFLPNCNDATVVSSARDGQVRVADISTTGSCRGTKKVAQHRGSAHKLALDADARSTFLSCGEDGVVFGIDLRSDKPTDKLVTVKVENKKIPLYSIHCNPSRSYEFAVSGKEDSARIYDRRMLTGDESTTPVKLYCPHHLQGTDSKANITCLVYNWDGSELLCSYNDEDIYLFDTTHSSGDDYVKRYKGHRNNATVKGVNFYGPYSEYVVSGSDCGHIFFWEKSSSRVVTLVKGDEGGVVNVLEPHPNLPVIATSGLDHEVKIWSPHASHDRDDAPDLYTVMLANRRSREEDRHSWREMMIDEHMLWFLMRTLRSRRRLNLSRDGNDDENDITSSDDEESPNSSSDASSEDEDRFCVQS